jgi:hypothetical protein
MRAVPAGFIFLMTFMLNTSDVLSDEPLWKSESEGTFVFVDGQSQPVKLCIFNYFMSPVAHVGDTAHILAGVKNWGPGTIDPVSYSLNISPPLPRSCFVSDLAIQNSSPVNKKHTLSSKRCHACEALLILWTPLSSSAANG